MADLLLEHPSAEARLRRMAFQLMEYYFGQPLPALVGLKEKGPRLVEYLNNVLYETVGKSAAVGYWSQQEGISFQEAFQPEALVLVDDVLYTGSTMYYALRDAMELNPKVVQVAVLVDRGHRKLPIRPDYVGLELATTLQEYVRIRIDEAGQISGTLE